MFALYYNQKYGRLIWWLTKASVKVAIQLITTFDLILIVILLVIVHVANELLNLTCNCFLFYNCFFILQIWNYGTNEKYDTYKDLESKNKKRGFTLKNFVLQNVNTVFMIVFHLNKTEFSRNYWSIKNNEKRINLHLKEL